jgi:prolipoprotein diacylglyceryltransferase
MRPIIVSFNGLTIYSYGLCVALGFVAYSFLVFYGGRRRGLSWHQILILYLAALVGAALGSRVVWIAMLGPQPELLGFYTLFLPTQVHFHYLGVLVGGYVGVEAAKALIDWPHMVGDLYAPALALMMVLVRIGCALGGCCYGQPTDLPWAVEMHGARRHPTQVYELAFQLVALGVLVSWRDRLPHAGDLFKLYLGAYAVFRFVNEFWRVNPVVALGMTVPQWICLGILAFVAGSLLARKQAKIGC